MLVQPVLDEIAPCLSVIVRVVDVDTRFHLRKAGSVNNYGVCLTMLPLT